MTDEYEAEVMEHFAEWASSFNVKLPPEGQRATFEAGDLIEAFKGGWIARGVSDASSTELCNRATTGA